MGVCTLVIILLCANAIMAPINFNHAKKLRDKVVEQRLYYIRDAQEAYSKQHNGAYCGTWSELIHFVKTAKLPKVSLTSEGWDTLLVNVRDSILPKGYNPDSLKYVPYGSGITFELAAKVDSFKTGVKVYLFQAQTPYNVYLYGLDSDELAGLNIIQKKLGKYCGLRIGSIEQPNNNSGNWEQASRYD
jgi:hypothetical protein